MLVSATIAAPLVFADSYSFTTIDVPGSTTTSASGINASGEIVGTYTDSSGNQHGFEYTNGTYTTINGPGSYTQVNGINNSGQIVGNSGLTGFIDTNGTFTTISGPQPFAIETYAYGINNLGQVVGNYEHDPVGLTPYIYSGGTLTTLPSFPAGPPRGINDSGEIVGYYNTDPLIQPPIAFIYSNGTTASFSVPGASSTQAFGVNNAGEIVGGYPTSFTSSAGFLYVNDALTTIDVPGASSTTAYGINDAGDIVGSFVDPSGTVGFLAMPVAAAAPEPVSVALLSVGFAGLAVLRRRRR
jgi:probable HAF family extracellular repeat protein